MKLLRLVAAVLALAGPAACTSSPVIAADAQKCVPAGDFLEKFVRPAVEMGAEARRLTEPDDLRAYLVALLTLTDDPQMVERIGAQREIVALVIVEIDGVVFVTLMQAQAACLAIQMPARLHHEIMLRLAAGRA